MTRHHSHRSHRGVRKVRKEDETTAPVLEAAEDVISEPQYTVLTAGEWSEWALDREGRGFYFRNRVGIDGTFGLDPRLPAIFTDVLSTQATWNTTSHPTALSKPLAYPPTPPATKPTTLRNLHLCNTSVQNPSDTRNETSITGKTGRVAHPISATLRTTKTLKHKKERLASRSQLSSTSTRRTTSRSWYRTSGAVGRRA